MKAALIGIALALVGAAAAFLWVHFHTSAPEVACRDRSPQPTIIAFGDSLVAGYGAPEGQGFVDDLSRLIGIPIQNLGVNGNTTADGLARIETIDARKPNIVIILLGGNDALQKKPQSETEGNLDAILSHLTTSHIKTILVGVPGGFLSDPYASMYRSLARKYNAAYVPNILSGLLGHSDLMSDEVHPNAVGYQKIADRIASTLEQTCR